MKAFELKSAFVPSGQQPDVIDQLSKGLDEGLLYQTLLGVTGSGKTYMAANIIAKTQRPALFIAPNKTLAAQLYGEMKSFFPDNAVEYFVSYYDYYQPEAYIPASNTYIQKDAAVNSYIEQMRLSATKATLERPDVIVVATVSAIYGLGDPESYLKMVLHLSCGELIDQRSITRRLVAMQYNRNDVSFERGTFRVRGEVIDIFPAESAELAIRIELFDDEIAALYELDPLTGSMNKKIDRVTIYPKSHYVTPKENVLAIIDDVKAELKVRLDDLKDQQKLVEAQRLEERVMYDIEMMTQLGYCQGIENYSRYVSGRGSGEPPPTLMEYIPKNALLFIDESHVTVSQLGAMYRGDRSRKATLVEHGFRLPSAMDNRPLRFDEFERLTPQTIFISATPGAYELEQSGGVAECIVRPTGLLDPEVTIRPVATQVDDLLSELNQCAERNERALVTTLTKRMSEDLSEYLTEHGIKVRYLHSDIGTVERMEIIHDLRAGRFDVLVGINLLREGLDIPEVALVAILDADKEGFLRSERSLIQSMGRAARHVDGRVIFYADTITGSIERAVAVTKKRRSIQEAYNKQHGITPKGIAKAVKDTLNAQGELLADVSDVPDVASQIVDMTPHEQQQYVVSLEKKMYQHAQDMEFEEAAKIRDEIIQINAMIYRA